MSHGVWHASGVPAMRQAKTASASDRADSLVVRGDTLTVMKNGKRVRIFVEYVGHGTVEGTVLRTAGGFRKGAWIHAPLRDAVGIKEYAIRVTQTELD
jgi:hypothetical protein